MVFFMLYTYRCGMLKKYVVNTLNQSRPATGRDLLKALRLYSFVQVSARDLKPELSTLTGNSHRVQPFLDIRLTATLHFSRVMQFSRCGAYPARGVNFVNMITRLLTSAATRAEARRRGARPRVPLTILSINIPQRYVKQ